MYSRFANIYCAECHGVKEIHYWTLDIGCVEVANDACAYPLPLGAYCCPHIPLRDTPWLKIFQNNPSLRELLYR